VHAEHPAPEWATESPRYRLAPGATALALQRKVGNRAARQLLARAPTGYPWIGRIRPWSAALRAAPSPPAGPKARVLADVPRGTEVTVVNRKSGWLAVDVEIGGVPMTGYVSRELVEFERMSAFSLSPIVVSVKVPSVAEAFVELKRLEKRREAAAGKLTLSEDEEADADLAISVLQKTGKYTVDPSTFVVSFDRSSSPKAQVRTIEDFILFVEEVERAFPAAGPGEIASEIRQLWYSDENWDVLSAGQGIKRGSKLVDIETEAPVATSFDMKQIAPASGSLKLDTPGGIKVDIGHVMAGIDVRLNGSPSTYPESYMERRDHDTYKNEAKYDAMKAASGGDTTDFGTWSGDIGQAYAEYIADRYLKGNTSATLAASMTSWAPREELLGDIHGYIAVKVWQTVPVSDSPTGGQKKVSNFLRDMYLVPKRSVSYRSLFETITGKSGGDLKKHMTERSLAFARLWYSKIAYSRRGWWSSEGWGPTEILKNYRLEFDGHHATNEASAGPKNKIETVIDDLLRELEGKVR